MSVWLQFPHRAQRSCSPSSQPNTDLSELWGLKNSPHHPLTTLPYGRQQERPEHNYRGRRHSYRQKKATKLVSWMWLQLLGTLFMSWLMKGNFTLLDKNDLLCSRKCKRNITNIISKPIFSQAALSADPYITNYHSHLKDSQMREMNELILHSDERWTGV